MGVTAAMPSSVRCTAAKLGIAFWDDLGARLGIHADTPVPYLPNLIRCRGQPA